MNVDCEAMEVEGRGDEACVRRECRCVESRRRGRHVVENIIDRPIFDYVPCQLLVTLHHNFLHCKVQT